MCVDGALRLNNGKVVALEVKHSLGWLRACNVRAQIQRLLKDPEMWGYFNTYTSTKLDGALIVFKNFSADWNREWSKRKAEKGWSYFYEEENLIGVLEIPIRIAQLTKEGLVFGIL